MSLAVRAANHLPVLVPAIPIFCHTATWYYAAKEAQAIGLTNHKTDNTILGNIADIAPQKAILDLAKKAGIWDFNLLPSTPPDGSVLVWLQAPTHSAIVSGNNQISGYNQVNQWDGSGVNHSTNALANLVANQKIVKVISEDTIVKEAGRLGL